MLLIYLYVIHTLKTEPIAYRLRYKLFDTKQKSHVAPTLHYEIFSARYFHHSNICDVPVCSAENECLS